MIRLASTRLRKGLAGVKSLVQGYPFKFDLTKKQTLDVAFTEVVPDARSFVDLGGVWRINGAYTFYLLDTYKFDRAFLVDTNVTQEVWAKRKSYPNLDLIEKNFSEPDMQRRIGPVDAIILFDVLLHQVAPDWKDTLESFAKATHCFIIYNQQFVARSTTVRLPDLGKEEYFRHVPMDKRSLAYRNLFERPNDIHPEHGKPWRDIHNVWQWGITDDDLIATMSRLGFTLEYRENFGQFSNFKSFENHAFVFLQARV